MEINIDSKRNNPLLNRTEIHFSIQHEGEKTPNREIIKSELSEKLNVKKDNIIINNIYSSTGIQKTSGYAKIYSNIKMTKELERKHILKRNKIISGKEVKKEDKKIDEKTEVTEEPKKENDSSEENIQKEDKTEGSQEKKE
jgi:small subunit ribosomal protein S24e